MKQYRNVSIAAIVILMVMAIAVAVNTFSYSEDPEPSSAMPDSARAPSAESGERDHLLDPAAATIASEEEAHSRRLPEEPADEEPQEGRAPADISAEPDDSRSEQDRKVGYAQRIEERKQIVLSQYASPEEKGKALKSLTSALVDSEDPLRRQILEEAARLIENSVDHDVLDDVFDGISKVQDEVLLDPILNCLVHHRDERVRAYAAEALHGYDEDERAIEALERAARYDVSERVRRRAAAMETE